MIKPVKYSLITVSIIIGVILFYWITAGFPSYNKTTIVKKIEVMLKEKRSDSEMILSVLKSLQTSYEKNKIKLEIPKNIDRIDFFIYENIRDNYYGFLPHDPHEPLPYGLRNNFKNLNIFVAIADSNIYRFTFDKSFSLNSEIYLIYKKMPDYNLPNENELRKNFDNTNSRSWLYKLDEHWAILSSELE